MLRPRRGHHGLAALVIFVLAPAAAGCASKSETCIRVMDEEGHPVEGAVVKWGVQEGFRLVDVLAPLAPPGYYVVVATTDGAGLACAILEPHGRAVAVGHPDHGVHSFTRGTSPVVLSPATRSESGNTDRGGQYGEYLEYMLELPVDESSPLQKSDIRRLLEEHRHP